MAVRLKIATLVILSLCLPTTIALALPQKGEPRPITTYSQQTLLKNWALTVCLAQSFLGSKTSDDAGDTASGYLEFGRQGLEAYDKLRKLSRQFADKTYASSSTSEFRVRKCLDLFHSKELDDLTRRLAREK